MVFILVLSCLGLCFALAVVCRYYFASGASTVAHSIIKEVALDLSQEQWLSAGRKLEPFLNRKNCPVEMIFFQSRILRETFRFEEARSLMNTRSFERTEMFAVNLEKGRIFYGLSNFQQVIASYERVLPRLIDDIDLFFYADALIKMGHFRRAFDFLSSILTEDSSREIKILMGDVYFYFKKYSETIFTYESCILSDYSMTESGLLRKLGHAYRLLGRYTEAMTIFRLLVNRDRSDESSLLSLGLCEYNQRRYKKALLIFQSGRLWSDGHPILMKYGGDVAINLHDYQLAEYCYDIAFRKGILGLSSAESLINFGWVLEKIGKYGEAEFIYREGIRIFPDCYVGYGALARMFGVGISSSVSSEEGIFLASRIVQMQNDPVNLEILSACNARIGNFAEAYNIQKLLIPYDRNLDQKKRRCRILRHLRNSLPLDGEHLPNYKPVTAGSISQ